MATIPKLTQTRSGGNDGIRMISNENACNRPQYLFPGRRKIPLLVACSAYLRIFSGDTDISCLCASLSTCNITSCLHKPRFQCFSQQKRYHDGLVNILLTGSRAYNVCPSFSFCYIIHAMCERDKHISANLSFSSVSLSCDNVDIM